MQSRLFTKSGSKEFEKSAYTTQQTMRTSTKPGTVQAFSTMQAIGEKKRDSIGLFNEAQQ